MSNPFKVDMSNQGKSLVAYFYGEKRLFSMNEQPNFLEIGLFFLGVIYFSYIFSKIFNEITEVIL